MTGVMEEWIYIWKEMWNYLGQKLAEKLRTLMPDKLGLGRFILNDYNVNHATSLRVVKDTPTHEQRRPPVKASPI